MTELAGTGQELWCHFFDGEDHTGRKVFFAAPYVRANVLVGLGEECRKQKKNGGDKVTRCPSDSSVGRMIMSSPKAE